tara:strand:- start:198 stop:479 length:282 start_codon:yes stop_codon:yes gene_type:complete
MKRGVTTGIIIGTAGAGVISLFSYFGWLGNTVYIMSGDLSEVKANVKNISNRVDRIESKLYGARALDLIETYGVVPEEPKDVWGKSIRGRAGE